MKFLPGDTYIYDSPVYKGNRIAIRSDEGNWHVVPSEKDSGPFQDEHMQSHLDVKPHFSDVPAVFIRRGVDILPDILLGYGDNIQF